MKPSGPPYLNGELGLKKRKYLKPPPPRRWLWDPMAQRQVSRFHSGLGQSLVSLAFRIWFQASYSSFGPLLLISNKLLPSFLDPLFSTWLYVLLCYYLPLVPKVYSPWVCESLVYSVPEDVSPAPLKVQGKNKLNVSTLGDVCLLQEES